MKPNKKIIFSILLVILTAIAFFRLSGFFKNSANPLLRIKDGGTAITFDSPAVKVVRWNRLLIPEGIYKKKSIYLYPYSNKSLNELWELEKNSSNFDKYVFIEN